jgi:hypothetical protein
MAALRAYVTARCGPNTFRVNGLSDENKPRNILEEIVWYATLGQLGLVTSQVPVCMFSGLLRSTRWHLVTINGASASH